MPAWLVWGLGTTLAVLAYVAGGYGLLRATMGRSTFLALMVVMGWIVVWPTLLIFYLSAYVSSL